MRFDGIMMLRGIIRLIGKYVTMACGFECNELQ